MVSATVLTALQVAVAASVFLTGFLAVRIHGDLDNAKQVAAQAIKRLDELTRDGRIITPEDAITSARAYNQALEPDPVARWANYLAVGK